MTDCSLLLDRMVENCPPTYQGVDSPLPLDSIIVNVHTFRHWLELLKRAMALRSSCVFNEEVQERVPSLLHLLSQDRQVFVP
ncbi:hypothetical protein JTB14_026332 [Gonioctena quinquepunctata]|nr:hypothetical protein JTB14_026332 [Gonioctena quinquepunctata]